MILEAMAQTLPGLQQAAAQVQAPLLSANPIPLLLNGLLAFLSPCILPMLPVYAAYMIGDTSDGKISRQSIAKLCGLAFGFILVFTTLGALGGLAGGALSSQNIGGFSVRQILDIVGNLLIIVFGLLMAGFIKGVAFTLYKGDASQYAKGGFWKSVAFGAILVLTWAPCLTPTLGLALTAATQSATAGFGVYALAMYALGLSIPFIVLLLLYQKLQTALGFIKSNAHLIRKIAGIAMIVLGLYRLFTLL
ncbi:MAG: cytochrome c biogenesis CcdA family protein [Eubacteriales bacterium]|nr:cytochrome c biogenesis CcdA family protein [Eubacteriales bacterium]